MQSLFGMEWRDYRCIRRLLGVDAGVGRPAEPDEETERAVWHALARRLELDPSHSLEPAQYLEVRAETGASLRAIWRHARRRADAGAVDSISG